ncbi:hypothetical protein Tco_0374349 [Tanacetum coccineum]
MYSLASWNIKGNSGLDKLCRKVFWNWHWTSNGAVCTKVSRIILGWNPDVVNVVFVSFDDQVLHSCVHFKADNKDLFCSWIYAHNRYQQRRSLWRNRLTYKSYIRGRPRCLLGDFNVSLSIDDKSTCTSYVDIEMRDFQECIKEIEVTDLNSTRLRFTWNQKPRGMDGVLKKINRIMKNLEASNVFTRASVFFHPYRISDHTPAILRIPMTSPTRPKMFKFANILLQQPRFREIVLHEWQTNISGFWMYKAVKRLKLLKKPLRKLLFDQGNIFDTVKRLRVELDSVQLALNSDPSNSKRREEVAAYLNAYLEASRVEERFLQQKAKVDWLRLGDANTTYFHKVVPVAFIDHYSVFLGQQGTTGPLNITDLFRTQLSHDEAEYMVREVSESKIRDAMFSMGDDKSPGLDGYSAAFFKEVWDIVSQDVIKVVDIQKAYDTVDWDFLRDVLKGFGFHSRMIGWIMEYVTSTLFSISINGSLHGYFKGKSRLWKGDPMSPYLFTLVMEILTLMFHRRVIMDALEEFKVVSGLTPSLPKSTAYFCNVLNYVKFDILGILPFEEGKLPVKYLGIPLVPSPSLYCNCTELIEKVKKRIGDWKNKSQSTARRAQLIPSVLASMHVFWASVFILPSRLMLELEQSMRGFLWYEGDMRRGKAKVAWDSVCLPNVEGGLDWEMVWNRLKPYMLVTNMSSSLDQIIDFLEPLFNKKSARSIIIKLVFAASCYLIWKERNDRLFSQKKLSSDQVAESIISTVRLKLLLCRFKKTENVQRLLKLWKIPGRIQALEQETRDLDVENKQMKVLKSNYGITTPQELRRNLIKARMVITIVMV